MGQIRGWKKISNPVGCSHKWERIKDNAFLEVSASTAYGCRGGYVVVLWTNKSSKPHGIAGSETRSGAIKKAIMYMRSHPNG